MCMYVWMYIINILSLSLCFCAYVCVCVWVPHCFSLSLAVSVSLPLSISSRCRAPTAAPHPAWARAPARAFARGPLLSRRARMSVRSDSRCAWSRVPSATLARVRKRARMRACWHGRCAMRGRAYARAGGSAPPADATAARCFMRYRRGFTSICRRIPSKAVRASLHLLSRRASQTFRGENKLLNDGSFVYSLPWTQNEFC